MSIREIAARVFPFLLMLSGGLAALTAVLHDRFTGGAADFGVEQCVLLLLGGLLALEGALELTTRDRPALWSVAASDSRRAQQVGFAIALLLVSVLAVNFASYRVDDAYISYRYAQHFALGLGPVWNTGEPAVEGYSNFLWTVIHAAGLALGLEPLALSRVLSFACLLGSLIAMHRLARAMVGPGALAMLPVVLFAATPSFALWAMSGLETVSVVLLVLLHLLAFRHEFGRPGWPVRTALTAVLLVLSRPEAPFFILLILAPALLEARPHRVRFLVRAVALVAVPLVPYVAWKWAEFGALIPNTAVAKTRPMQGLPLTMQFFLLVFPILVLAPLRLTRGATLTEKQILSLALGVLLASMNVAPHVGHYHRFFLPVLAPLLALVAPIAHDLSSARAVPIPRRGGALIATLTMMAYMLAPWPAMASYARLEEQGLRAAHEALARDLKASHVPGELLADSDCGLVPYRTGLRTIDLWGLTDRTIAAHGFSTRYVLDQRPDVIVLHSLYPDRFMGRESYDRALQAALASRGEYALAGCYPFYGYWLWRYERRRPVHRL